MKVDDNEDLLDWLNKYWLQDSPRTKLLCWNREYVWVDCPCFNKDLR